MYADIIQFLRKRIPEYAEHNRNYLTIAIGCTGGQHRSVYLTERLARHFGDRYPSVTIRHRELT